MIRLPKMIEYFNQEVNNSNGVIKSIFLSFDNELIASVGVNSEQVAIYSTLLNDSAYIIHLSLNENEEVRKNQQMKQITLSIGEKQVFLYNIKGSMIIGVVTEIVNRAVCHKMASDIVNFMQDELENVLELYDNSEEN